MSISLNNIESRVTALENKVSTNKGFLVPDWSKCVDLGKGKVVEETPYTATETCLAHFSGFHSRSFEKIYINGIIISDCYYDYGGSDQEWYYLNKGDVIYGQSYHTCKIYSLKPATLYYNVADLVKYKFSVCLSLFKEVISYVNLLK